MNTNHPTRRRRVSPHLDLSTVVSCGWNLVVLCTFIIAFAWYTLKTKDLTWYHFTTIDRKPDGNFNENEDKFQMEMHV